MTCLHQSEQPAVVQAVQVDQGFNILAQSFCSALERQGQVTRAARPSPKVCINGQATLINLQAGSGILLHPAKRQRRTPQQYEAGPARQPGVKSNSSADVPDAAPAPVQACCCLRS